MSGAGPSPKRPRLSHEAEEQLTPAVSAEHLTFGCIKQGPLEDLYEAVEPEFVKAGNSAVVTKVRRRADGQLFAVKTMHIYDAEARKGVAHELEMLHRVREHPNVVQLEAVYYDQWDAHCVQTLCSGGELFDSIINVGHFSEAQASFLFRQIVGAIEHCHKQGVCHRDVKPEVHSRPCLVPESADGCCTEPALPRWKLTGRHNALILLEAGGFRAFCRLEQERRQNDSVLWH